MPEPRNGNLFARIDRTLCADPHAVLLETDRGQHVSAAALRQTSGQLAAALVARGVEPGDRVAVQVEKSAEAVALYLACLRIGAVYLPLNTAYREAEIEHFVTDAEPRAMVADPAAEDRLHRLLPDACRLLTLGRSGEGSLLDATRNIEPIEAMAPRRGRDAAAILYTSGTTGRPKGAVISHANLRANADALVDLWRMQPSDVLLHALPIYHVHGLFVALHCALWVGARMLFLDRFDPERVVRDLPRATVMMGVPTFYTRLLAHPGFDRDTCRSMRLFVSGSAPLLEATFEQFRASSGHTILERYGMTEAGMITSNPYQGDRIAGTVGYPLPGVEARVTDEDGVPLDRGQVGTLEIRGPNVFDGYWRRPDANRSCFRENRWFSTGDLVTCADDGRIAIVGRAKDLIISGGLNVYPKEVELALDKLDGVGESAVVGVPDADFGEAVTAVVVPADPANPPDPEALRTALREVLARFKIPKRVVLHDALPRNAMGKVQKNLLRDALDA